MWHQDLLMYAYDMLCIVMFNLVGVFAVFCFYFARWGLYNLYLLLMSWLTAMGLSALMDASVLKVTGSSALMVVSMMDGSDGRTQQSNLMVVGKITLTHTLITQCHVGD